MPPERKIENGGTENCNLIRVRKSIYNDFSPLSLAAARSRTNPVLDTEDAERTLEEARLGSFDTEDTESI